MEEAIWIDLGLIGHRSSSLKKLYMPEYLTELPQQVDDISENKWVVFIDYSLGGNGLFGTKVFTNAFPNDFAFFKSLTQKLISTYVAIDKPLDFNEDF